MSDMCTDNHMNSYSSLHYNQREKMKRIEETLIRKYSLEISDSNEDYIHASNDLIICLVVTPHSGTDNRWMVRFSTVAAFDRWANSCAIEEYFATEKEVIEYLSEKELCIYKQCH